MKDKKELEKKKDYKEYPEIPQNKKISAQDYNNMIANFEVLDKNNQLLEKQSDWIRENMLNALFLNDYYIIDVYNGEFRIHDFNGNIINKTKIEHSLDLVNGPKLTFTKNIFNTDYGIYLSNLGDTLHDWGIYVFESDHFSIIKPDLKEISEIFKKNYGFDPYYNNQFTEFNLYLYKDGHRVLWIYGGQNNNTDIKYFALNLDTKEFIQTQWLSNWFLKIHNSTNLHPIIDDIRYFEWKGDIITVYAINIKGDITRYTLDVKNEKEKVEILYSGLNPSPYSGYEFIVWPLIGNDQNIKGYTILKEDRDNDQDIFQIFNANGSLFKEIKLHYGSGYNIMNQYFIVNKTKPISNSLTNIEINSLKPEQLFKNWLTTAAGLADMGYSQFKEVKNIVDGDFLTNMKNDIKNDNSFYKEKKFINVNNGLGMFLNFGYSSGNDYLIIAYSIQSLDGQTRYIILNNSKFDKNVFLSKINKFVDIFDFGYEFEHEEDNGLWLKFFIDGFIGFE